MSIWVRDDWDMRTIGEKRCKCGGREALGFNKVVKKRKKKEKKQSLQAVASGSSYL